MRIALYYTPAPGHPLADFAARWFAPDNLPEETAPARFYGFHATLKPPFALKSAQSLDKLLAAAQAFARQRRSLDIGRLRLGTLGRFLALVPEAPSAELQALAAACVMDFDDFRAPAAAAELAKRRAAGLTAQQEALLARWGYPYVMEAFRFHMTLTGSLAEDARQAAEAQALARLGGVLAAPMVLDALTLSLQTGPGRPFIAWRRLPFGGRLPIDQGR